MKEVSSWKIIWKQIIVWMAIVGIMYLFTRLGLSMVIVNIFFVISTFACMFKLWKKQCSGRRELLLISVGIFVRIVVSLIDIYGSTLVTIPFSGDDSTNFYNVSVAYYYGDTSKVYTNYPYILNMIYQITGLNRFAAQYVNILCWGFCMLLLQKTCGLLKIDLELRELGIALFAFLPFNICISSILTRDLLVTLAISIAVYSLLQWMKNGDYIYAALCMGAALPAMFLNNCMIAVITVAVLVIAIYSPKKEKFCVEKKSVAVATLALGAIAFVLFNEKIRVAIFTQIPLSKDGILDAINGRLEFFSTYAGGSSYLVNEYVNSYIELFLGTFKRIAYFLFSPLPFLWRGFADVLAFFTSSSVYLMSTIIFFVSLYFKRKDPYRFVLFMTVFGVSTIFAWGVGNGGTAMRHREKILEIFIFLAIYSLQIVKNFKKDAAEEEE